MKFRLVLLHVAILVALVHESASNVDEICGLDTTEELVSRLHSARGVATNWLSNNRGSHSFGWSLGNTAAAVTSLQLTNESWIATPSLEMRLTLKELQLEILSVLSQSERTLIPTLRHLTKHQRLMQRRLPAYVMALHATCHDVNDYHGIDLISLLSDNMRRFRRDALYDFYQHAQSVLAMCSTGHPVKWQYVEELLQGQRPDGCFHKPCVSACPNERIDTTSMVLSAMACVHNASAKHAHRLGRDIQRAAECLVNARNSHGGFGNAINNALAAQALLSAGYNHSEWDCHATVSSVIDSMHPDGHYGNLAATVHVLPLLAGRHHGHMKSLEFDCPQDDSQIRKSSYPDILPDDETITVYLNIQDHTGKRYHTLEGVSGESLLDLMYRQLYSTNVLFTFESEMTDWGEYITSIDGIENDLDGYRNWIIEKIVMRQPQCIDKGVGDIYPEDGELYKWVYRGCVSSSKSDVTV